MNAVEEADNPDLEPVEETAEAFYQEAFYIYQHVYVEGMPAFRSFAEWLRDNAPREGEFHVGRDTLNTTFIASNALRWGKMTGRERAQAIKHINVSRTTENSGVARDVIEAFLAQERINRYMLGVDGGFSGNSPRYILEYLIPGFDEDLADQKIRIMGTRGMYQRLFDPSNNYERLVELMEKFPKFTDRAKEIELVTHSVQRYKLNTPARSVGDGILAWVVQHAVWRDLCPKTDDLPELTPEQTEEMHLSKRAYEDSIHGQVRTRHDRTKAHIKIHKKPYRP